MRRAATAEVRLDRGKAACSSAARRATRRCGCQRDRLRSNFVATRLGQTEARAQQPGYPGDVGSHSLLVEDMRGHQYPRPLATMRAYLDGMEKAAAAFPALSEPSPIVLAALGPQMTAL